MDRFDTLISEMDFTYFATGEHAISPEGAAKLVGSDKVFFLDVRTRNEAACLSFPFALNIPVNEMPSRLDELPKDKLIIVFCSSIFRGAMTYGYLLHKGFDQVKGLTGPLEQLVAQLKPGPLYKNSVSG
jgi:rhodanese-related sulfurtransferase